MEERRKIKLDTIIIAILFTNKFTKSDKWFLQDVRPHRTFVVCDATDEERQLMEESTFYRLEFINVDALSGGVLEEQVVIAVLGVTSRGQPNRIIYMKGDPAFLKKYEINLDRVKELFEAAHAEVIVGVQDVV